MELDIKINSSIEVIVDEKSYKALIIDVEDDNIKINIPVYNSEYLMLYRGDKIEINLYMDERSCFNYYCNVLSKGRDNNVIYYKLTRPYNIRKIQRRNFFRLSLLEDIKYKNIMNKSNEEIEALCYKDGIMVDLSGSGLKLKTKEKLKENDVIIIKIAEFKFKLKGQVVREEISENNNIFIYGVKFLEISDRESDKIIKKIFKIVRKRRMKNM